MVNGGEFYGISLSCALPTMATEDAVNHSPYNKVYLSCSRLPRNFSVGVRSSVTHRIVKLSMIVTAFPSEPSLQQEGRGNVYVFLGSLMDSRLGNFVRGI